jgi:phosphoglycolate phosphatase
MSPDILSGKKLVIFDVDGVIFDIVEAIRETVKEGIEKYHLKANVEDAMEEVGHVLEFAQSMPIPELVLNSNELFGKLSLFEGLTVLKRLRIAASFYGSFRQKKEQCGLFDGIEDVIKGLSKKGLRLAILSNNKRSYVIEALKKQNLEGYFGNILGFNEVSKTKPDPEGLLKILEMEKIQANEAIFIGDMVSDVQCGKSAKVNTIAVASGLAPKEKLVAEQPFQLVNTIREMQKLFGV